MCGIFTTICSCVCDHMWPRVHMFRCSHAYGGQRSLPGVSLITPTLAFETEPLMESRAHPPAGQWAAGTCPPLLSQQRAHKCTRPPEACMWVLEIQTQASTLLQLTLSIWAVSQALPKLFCFTFRGVSLTVCPSMTWSSICRPGRLQSQKRFSCLCLARAEIKGEHHQTQLKKYFKYS